MHVSISNLKRIDGEPVPDISASLDSDTLSVFIQAGDIRVRSVLNDMLRESLSHSSTFLLRRHPASISHGYDQYVADPHAFERILDYLNRGVIYNQQIYFVCTSFTDLILDLELVDHDKLFDGRIKINDRWLRNVEVGVSKRDTGLWSIWARPLGRQITYL